MKKILMVHMCMETGLLFAPGDVDTLTDYMCRMIANPALRQRLGEAMFRRIDQYFSLENTVDSQQEIYETILAQSAQSHEPTTE